MNLWTVAHQAPLSMGFPRQECWSGLPFLSSRDLPNPEIGSASPVSPALPGGLLSYLNSLSGAPDPDCAEERGLEIARMVSWRNTKISHSFL